MNATLYLSAGEMEVFDGLSTDLREGWGVEPEAAKSFERPEELIMRYRMASFSSDACKALAEKAQEAKTPQEIEKLAGSFNVSALSLGDLSELFFVLGTRWMSHAIGYLLKNVQSDEDIEGLATFTHIRHMLCQTNGERS